MKIIGHRGAKGLAPENTLISFEKALLHNVDEVECDVHVTADNIPVIAHDPEIHDRSGTPLRIDQYTYKELLAAKPDLVTMDQMFRFIDRRVPVYLEIKPKQHTPPIIAGIRRLVKDGWTVDDIYFASFDHRMLHSVHAAFPDMRIIVLGNWSSVMTQYRAKQLDTKYISLDQKYLWSGSIRRAARGGWQVYTYTLNNAAKARRWRQAGLYATVTDIPDAYQSSDRS